VPKPAITDPLLETAYALLSKPPVGRSPSDVMTGVVVVQRNASKSSSALLDPTTVVPSFEIA
jgi:hypothetical protein